MIEPMDLGGALEESALFNKLHSEDLDIVAGLVHEGEIEKGQILFREHDLSDCLYIVRQGVLSLYKEFGGGTKILIASIGSGEFLGEMGLVCDEPRSLTAEAMQDVSYWRLSQTDYRRLCMTQPSVGMTVNRNIAMVLSHRLVTANERMVKSLGSGGDKASLALLAEVLAETLHRPR